MTATSTDGFLLVDKPAGVTSHDVVAVARRALGGIKAGHTGTLDPFATGLLLILTGAATRIARYVPGDPKLYRAAVTFGAETDTGDATGLETATAQPPDESAVMAAMRTLTGTFEQTPPAFSAKQIAGRRAYAMARRGTTMQLAPVPVTVHEWQVLSRDGDTWHVTVSCDRGTYVRALARDLGRLSDSAAHLSQLRRLRAGPFTVEDAADLEGVKRMRALRPALDAVPQLAREQLGIESLRDVRHGRVVGATVPGEHAALVAPGGALAAIAERRDGTWQPVVVLAHD